MFFLDPVGRKPAMLILFSGLWPWLFVHGLLGAPDLRMGPQSPGARWQMEQFRNA